MTSLLILHNDLQLLTTPLLTLTKSWPIPETLLQQTCEQVEKTWKSEYEPIQIEIQSKIVNVIFLKCNEVIKQVRNIPSQFRGTLKENPTKPSIFLSGIFQPIVNFKKLYSSSLVDTISQKIQSQVITR